MFTTWQTLISINVLRFLRWTNTWAMRRNKHLGWYENSILSTRSQHNYEIKKYEQICCFTLNSAFAYSFVPWNGGSFTFTPREHFDRSINGICLYEPNAIRLKERRSAWSWMRTQRPELRVGSFEELNQNEFGHKKLQITKMERSSDNNNRKTENHANLAIGMEENIWMYASFGSFVLAHCIYL